MCPIKDFKAPHLIFEISYVNNQVAYCNNLARVNKNIFLFNIVVFKY